MKKLISAAIVFLAVLCLSACGAKTEGFSAGESDPQKIVVITDSEGFTRELCFTDAEEIAGFMELYRQVEIGEMTDIMTTDSYNSILFYGEDGSCRRVSINGSCLEKEVKGQLHYFELINYKPLRFYIQNHGTAAVEQGV